MPAPPIIRRFPRKSSKPSALAPDSADDVPVFEEPTDKVALPHPAEPASVRLSRLREKAKTLPSSPGVYLMKDTRGVVIYVGKSRSLRDRVGSYFTPSTDLGPFGKQLLLEYVADFDTLSCETEVEALLSENRLIKDIQPRCNARLLDDKTYPYLEIMTREDYPGVYVTRSRRIRGRSSMGRLSVRQICGRRCRTCSGRLSSARAIWKFWKPTRGSGFFGRACSMQSTNARPRVRRRLPRMRMPKTSIG